MLLARLAPVNPKQPVTPDLVVPVLKPRVHPADVKGEFSLLTRTCSPNATESLSSPPFGAEIRIWLG